MLKKKPTFEIFLMFTVTLLHRWLWHFLFVSSFPLTKHCGTYTRMLLWADNSFEPPHPLAGQGGVTTFPHRLAEEKPKWALSLLRPASLIILTGHRVTSSLLHDRDTFSDQNTRDSLCSWTFLTNHLATIQNIPITTQYWTNNLYKLLSNCIATAWHTTTTARLGI